MYESRNVPQFAQSTTANSSFTGGAEGPSAPVSDILMQCVGTAEHLSKALSELHGRLSPVLAYPPPQANGKDGAPVGGGCPLEQALHEHCAKLQAILSAVQDISGRVRV